MRIAAVSYKIHNGRLLKISLAHRLDRLVAILKEELDATPEQFGVNVVQLYYNVDGAGDYKEVHWEDITQIVAV